MSGTFQVGDRVSLKSGGPAMTVESIDGDYGTCVWFDGQNELKRNDFLLAVLQKTNRTTGVRLNRS